MENLPLFSMVNHDQAPEGIPFVSQPQRGLV